MNANRFIISAFVLVGLAVLGLTAIRVFNPDDLMTGYQEPPASCVLDALRNGHWICQDEFTGWVTSKPPLYTWLAALAALPFSHVSRSLLLTPSFLSVAVLAWLILQWARGPFGAAAGFFAALTFVLSPLSSRLTAIARTDALFALTVALTAWLGFRAWRKGSGWMWFWVAGAAATLAKGPLGLLLGGSGLLVALWEKPPGKSPTRLRQHAAGVMLYLAIVLGWWLSAYAEVGNRLVEKMLGMELLASAGADSGFTLRQLVIPSLYLLGRYAPWSLFTCVGVWRVIRRPAKGDDERQFERWLLCWLLGGLAMFSLGVHQRPDLLYPLFPPAAWLAGREIRRVLPPLRPKYLLLAGAACAMLCLGITGCYYRFHKGNEDYIRGTAAMKALAASIQARVGADFPLVHLESSPYALQFYLNTMTPFVTTEDAARLLLGSNAVFVVLSDTNSIVAGTGESCKLRRLVGSGTPYTELDRWPAEGAAMVRLVSNHPRLEYAKSMAFGTGHIMLQWHDMRMLARRGESFVFRGLDDKAFVEFANTSAEPQRITLTITRAAADRRETFVLGPHQVRRFSTERH